MIIEYIEYYGCDDYHECHCPSCADDEKKEEVWVEDKIHDSSETGKNLEKKTRDQEQDSTLSHQEIRASNVQVPPG